MAKDRFTAEELAHRAVEVLDAEGLNALTMRRIAAEMGVATTSSLYWRVRSKEDLLRVAVDQVFAEALPRSPVPLEERCLHAVETLAAHAWCPPLLATHTPSGPHYDAFAAGLFQGLVDAGVPEVRLGAAVAAVSYYMIGAATMTWRASDGPAGGLALSDPAREGALSSWLEQTPADPRDHVVAGLRLILSALGT